MQPRPRAMRRVLVRHRDRTAASPTAPARAEGLDQPPGSAPRPTGSALPRRCATPASAARPHPREQPGRGGERRGRQFDRARGSGRSQRRAFPRTSEYLGAGDRASNNPPAAAAASGAAHRRELGADAGGPERGDSGRGVQGDGASRHRSVDHASALAAALRLERRCKLVSASPGDMVPAAAGSPKVDTRGSGAQLDVTTTSDERCRQREPDGAAVQRRSPRDRDQHHGHG